MREAAEDESGCAAAADGTSCDDENPCTSDDACHSGRCVGVVPEECPTPGQCQVGVCDPTTGACDVTFEPFGTACDDGNGCTDNDFCGVSVCLPGPPHSCDDFDPCTTDACVAGAWGHGAVQCPPPSDVCVAPVCRSDFSSGLRGCGFEPITDCCHDDAECDDGNVCTHDACDPGSHGCAHTPLECWFLTGTTTATASAAGRTVTRRSRLGAALVVDEERRYRLPEFAGCTTDTAVDEIGHFSPREEPPAARAGQPGRGAYGVRAVLARHSTPAPHGLGTGCRGCVAPPGRDRTFGRRAAPWNRVHDRADRPVHGDTGRSPADRTVGREPA